MDALSKTSLDALRDAGWRSQRRIDTAHWQTHVESEGFVFHQPAREFLEQFGGLQLASRNDGTIDFSPQTAIESLDAENDRPYLVKLFGHEPSPIGESTWTSIFAMDDYRILMFNVEMHRYCTFRNAYDFLNAEIDASFSSLLQFVDVPRGEIPACYNQA